MKTSETSAFVNQLLLYTLAILLTGGSVGFGTVWLRYQIAATANRLKANETRIEEFQRRLAETNTSIETEQSPDVLRRRNEQMRLGLVEPREVQVNRVAQDAELRLASKRNQGLFTDGPVLVSFRPLEPRPYKAR